MTTTHGRDVVGIENLSVTFATDSGAVDAVRDVSLSVAAGEASGDTVVTGPGRWS